MSGTVDYEEKRKIEEEELLKEKERLLAEREKVAKENEANSDEDLDDLDEEGTSLLPICLSYISFFDFIILKSLCLSLILII